MKIKNIMLFSALGAGIASTSLQGCKPANNPEGTPGNEFVTLADTFADIQVLRYQINDFETLTAKQKELCYYLYMAAQSGRDMIWDQNYKYNLIVRRTLEQIVKNYEGDKTSDEFEKFITYAKRVWFSNGIHHHYSTKKMIPTCAKAYFEELIRKSPRARFPMQKGETLEQFIGFILPQIFDPSIGAKRVNQAANIDIIKASANNFYENITQAQVEQYYKNTIDTTLTSPVSYGLNSKMEMVNGKVVENVWKIGGMYDKAIAQIVFWLKKAATVAENAKQQKALELLVRYYETGDLKLWDEYNIAWIADTESRIDVVNGFIEVYGDALGYRASYESVVSIKDMEASKRIAAIAKEAQWFEDQSPIQKEHKKEKVTGISAKVITVVSEAGDAAPATPIGINLPNANWIRQKHGSKSVSLGNIVYAYNDIASKSSAAKAFAFSDVELNRAKQYGALAADLHTDMHEVIGHASGKINKGVGETAETLKQYASTLEEARADLVALYYIMDQKLVDIGVMPSLEVGKAEYDNYIKNGLMLQLRRLAPGEQLEESHMRNRQLVAGWAFDKGKNEKVIAKIVKNGKTYFVVNDYAKLRMLFGELLREIQRIKSEGDFKAGMALVENYGVKVDEKLKLEVKKRFEAVNAKPYSGFIQPILTPVMDGDKITDVKVTYPTDFVAQMLFFGKEFSFLPNIN